MRAARQRAAIEREQRIERALKAMDEIDKTISGKSKRRQADIAPTDMTQDETARSETAADESARG